MSPLFAVNVTTTTKPGLNCPENITRQVSKTGEKALVRWILPDEHRVLPIEALLPAGEYVYTFPLSNSDEMCRLHISVKGYNYICKYRKQFFNLFFLFTESKPVIVKGTIKILP